jgi:glycosyltransferase involved in cell wall biosynthesis
MAVERQPSTVAESHRVLVVSHDLVGPRMAGPGIRYWELARVLAQHFPVTLAAPNVEMGLAPAIEVWPYDSSRWETLAPAVEQAQVILLSGDVLAWFPMLAATGVPLVIDGYDPHPFETLAQFAGSPEQESLHHQRESILQRQCRAGDFFVCASERQRDWWLGLLEATGRINVYTYAQDPSLRRLVDLVPFGLPGSPLQHNQQVLKGVWPGIGPADKVALWGGGLWQWLDPLTAIRAMARVRSDRPDVRLVFPGTRHPNATAIPAMPVLESAVALARNLGLLDQAVFFGDWVPYEQWPNYLAESDVGLALHLDTAETRLAFRSRLLDYIWAGLPMVVTTGDASGELVTRYGLGETVGYEDVEAVSRALLRLLDTSPATYAAGFQQARAALTWEQVAEPLIAFCRDPRRAPDKVAGYQPQPDSGTEKLLAEQQAEVQRLRALVQGYENGRFIRFMKWLRHLSRRTS